ncbi:hypothetical protein [Paenibacillus terrae]|uniref:Uncharacterized protein n=1 Tax=Paenibacillus terrae TaxID=159743 RepID=A0A0D7WYI3_9BACL|nr:hypothetical protein [Paenibacillus terrae]KJD44241.1 hypothetical protein QD47_18130 [Paenibacillus terrae]
MDNETKGLYDWFDSLKAQRDKADELAEAKRIEIKVLEARREVSGIAVDKIENAVLREKFYNEFIKGVNDAVEQASNELADLRKDRKELSAYVAAIEFAIENGPYRKTP